MKIAAAGSKVVSGASASRPMPQSKPSSGGKGAGASASLSSKVDFTSDEFFGMKPFKPIISVNQLEQRVCGEFDIPKWGLKKSFHKNLPRMGISRGWKAIMIEI